MGTQKLGPQKYKFQDLQFVEAPEPTSAERARVEKLLLPTSFYVYEGANQVSNKQSTDGKNAPVDEGRESVKKTVPSAKPNNETRNTGRKTPDSSTSVFGTRSTGSLLHFSAVTNSPFDMTSFSSSSTKGFSGQGSQLFVSRRSTGGDEGEDYDSENEEGGIAFQTVVSLPAVERVTGEENEVVKFSHRAKLYRFDKEISQWKERGVGDIKILQHKETGRSRVLMRRDQIHKLCANHFIVQDMKLVPNSGSDRSWVWHAHDFSEEVTRSEQLAMKFKSVPIAEQFRDVFYECQNETCSEIPQEKDVDQSLQLKENEGEGATTDKGSQNHESKKAEEISKSSSSTGFLFGSSSISSLILQCGWKCVFAQVARVSN